MKFLVLLAIFSIFLQSTLAYKTDALRVFNLQYTQASTKTLVKYSWHYDSMSINYENSDEDVDQTSFQFLWTYSSEDEKTAGHGAFNAINADFENVKDDSEKNGLIITFLGKDIQNLKFYKKTEFGSAYTLEFTQKTVTIQVQLQIKAHEVNDDEFHNIISKIIEKRTGHGLKFLEN